MKKLYYWWITAYQDVFQSKIVKSVLKQILHDIQNILKFNCKIVFYESRWIRDRRFEKKLYIWWYFTYSKYKQKRNFVNNIFN